MNKLTPAQRRANHLKAIRFERPDYIPVQFAINDACWQNYPQEALFDLMEAHSLLFPDFKRPKGVYVPEFSPNARKQQPYRDGFGCLWQTSEDGIVGTVVEHPLADWENFADYRFPNADETLGGLPVSWKDEQQRALDTRAKGGMFVGGLSHGHTFLRLCDIRGYEALLCDMMDEEPLLDELIKRNTDYNLEVVNHYLELGVDMLYYAEDLGMQSGPMLSPACFERYILPSYRRIMQPAKEKGVIIHVHADGDIRLLADQLIGCGVDVLNPQDLVNGIDWIRDELCGKVCVDINIDRQIVTPFGSPAEVDALILEEVQKLGSRAGGLTMFYDLYPGVPLENVAAVMDALEKYCTHYS